MEPRNPTPPHGGRRQPCSLHPALMPAAPGTSGTRVPAPGAGQEEHCVAPQQQDVQPKRCLAPKSQTQLIPVNSSLLIVPRPTSWLILWGTEQPPGPQQQRTASLHLSCPCQGCSCWQLPWSVPVLCDTRGHVSGDIPQPPVGLCSTRALRKGNTLSECPGGASPICSWGHSCPSLGEW